MKNKLAILTGSNGILGPIWEETLDEMGITCFGYDLPDHNVTSPEGAWGFVMSILDPGYSKVDILINNAAIDPKPVNGKGLFWEYDKVIDVNLKGAINMCEQVIPRMITYGGGLIINIGSIQGNIGADWRNYEEGFDKAVGYNVSKCGLIQLSRSICAQYGRYNIRAVTISFGPYDSGLPEKFKERFVRNIPLRRFISKESLKATLRYAIECPELTGQQILVDGGYTAW